MSAFLHFTKVTRVQFPHGPTIHFLNLILLGSPNLPQESSLLRMQRWESHKSYKGASIKAYLLLQCLNNILGEIKKIFPWKWCILQRFRLQICECQSVILSQSWPKSFAVFGDQIKDASRTRRGCLILWPYICKSGQSCCIIDKMRPFSSQQRYVLDLCFSAIMGGFHLYLFPFDFPFNYIVN